MKRVLMWVVLNGGMLACLWLSFEKVEVAENIALFMAWTCSVINILVGFLPGKDKRKLRTTAPRPVPQPMSVAVDILTLGALAGLGWFWTASVYFLGVLGQHLLYDAELEEPA